MIVLNELPVILTADRKWAADYKEIRIRPGRIVILPEDAVLIDVDAVSESSKESSSQRSAAYGCGHSGVGGWCADCQKALTAEVVAGWKKP